MVLQGTVNGTSGVSSSVENSNAIETMAEGGSVRRTSSPPTDEGIRSMEQGKLWLGWRFNVAYTVANILDRHMLFLLL